MQNPGELFCFAGVDFLLSRGDRFFCLAARITIGMTLIAMPIAEPATARRTGAGSLFARFISYPFPSPLVGEGAPSGADEGFTLRSIFASRGVPIKP